MRSAILAGVCATMVILAAAAQADPASDRDNPAVDPGEGGSLSDIFGSDTKTKVVDGQDGPDINAAGHDHCVPHGGFPRFNRGAGPHSS